MKSAMRFGAALTALVLAASAGQASPFTPGNLVVVQIGNGIDPLVAGGAPLFLVEMTTNGTIIQTIPLPTVTSGTSHAILVRGTSTSVGHLNRSVNGQYLTLTGIDGPIGGTTSISATQAATNPRIVARVDANGNVDTTTALTDSYNADDMRAAITTDGNDIWTVGTSGTTSTAGIRYTTFGSASATQLGAPPTNTRMLGIFNNQLYITSASTVFQGVSTVGTGIPNTPGQTITLLNGFPTATGPSSYDFYFSDTNTLYVADDRTIALGGGVQKWTFDGSIWTLQYTMNTGLTAGCRGLTATSTGGVITLWATSADATSGASGNKMVSVIDTGVASSFNTLATAPANVAYRGIDFAPAGGSVPSCYANCDASTSAPCLNVNDFTCFLNSYSAGAAYANCDASTLAPVLNVNDFTCFLNAYSAGCTNPCTAP